MLRHKTRHSLDEKFSHWHLRKGSSLYLKLKSERRVVNSSMNVVCKYSWAPWDQTAAVRQRAGRGYVTSWNMVTVY